MRMTGIGLALLTSAGGVFSIFRLKGRDGGVRSIEEKTPGEAMFYEKLDGAAVRCGLCFKRCIIGNGRRGFCRVRENRDGVLRSLVYGRPVGLQIDPIELEPLYHMLPGHRNLCVYTASCNFRCKHCHNWHISQRGFEELRHKQYSPEAVVEESLRRGCRSISHSINEPTVFYEYMYKIAGAARRRGLKVLLHTNGSINQAPLRRLLKRMDAVTVDLKAFNHKFYREISGGDLGHVLGTLKTIKSENTHLEIVNLVIPGLNDNTDEIKDMTMWIKENLGENTPLHFTRFSPSYKLVHLSRTPVPTLESAMDTAASSGLKYVYIGNVPGHRANNTYCPECKEVLIRRTHFIVIENKINRSGECIYCGFKIAGIWE